MRRRSLCAWLLGAARPARPLAPSRPPAAAAWAPDPGDLILEAEDAAVWAEERREYAACFAADAPEAAPAGLRGVYRRSFTAQATAADGATSVRYLHAFDAAYPPLSALDAQGRRNATDDATLRPIRDLLDATCFLHERGLPHLGLNGECVRVGSDGGGGAPRLKVVGAGAGPKLVATRRPFSLPETWAFNAPETLGAALVQSNLKALLRMDAWSVGVCCAMLLRRERASPFAAAANWRAGLFSDRDAVRARVDDVFADFSSFLTETNARSDGLLFRHGWLVEVLVGLLRRDPGDRLDVRRAARVARRAALQAQYAKATLAGGTGAAEMRDEANEADDYNKPEQAAAAPEHVMPELLDLVEGDMPERLAEWGCDAALWSVLPSGGRKNLRRFVRTNNEELGRRRIETMRAIAEFDNDPEPGSRDAWMKASNEWAKVEAEKLAEAIKAEKEAKKAARMAAAAAKKAAEAEAASG